jgi:hypothetical protein
MKTKTILLLMLTMAFVSLLGGLTSLAIVTFTGKPGHIGANTAAMVLLGIAATQALLAPIIIKLDAIEVALKKDRSAPIAMGESEVSPNTKR